METSFKNSYPQICGYYSITSERIFDETASALRYFKLPLDLPLDLNIGIESIKTKPNSYFEEKMESILTYIVKNKADFMCDSKMGDTLIPSTKYITYRGVIRKIMRSPYETRKGWCILVTKYKNNLYMSQQTELEDRNYYANEWCKKFADYGPKFQQYCLTDDPFETPDTSQAIDTCPQFFGVFQRMLVGRNFLFAGEMNGIVSDVPVNLNNLEQLKELKFIELTVVVDPSSSKKAPKKLRFKCQNVWTQCFLTGVEDVYLGMRDENGLVNKIEHYSTDDLIRLGQNDCDPSKCFKFLDEFLKLVEEKTNKIDCPNTVFEFNLNEITLNITCTEHPGKTELSLLPDWYLDAL